ncbi:hypothetical protein [Kitasatospora sp. Ki12]
MAAARAAAVVVATWLALIVLMVLVGLLLPGPRPHGALWSTVLALWLLALFIGPLVACLALRRWIAGSRAGSRAGSPDAPLPPGPGPYTHAWQDAPPSGGHTWRADASPPPRPPQPDEQRQERRSEAPRAAEDPDAEARRRRARADAERKRAAAERARKEEDRRRRARNRRRREGGGR